MVTDSIKLAPGVRAQGNLPALIPYEPAADCAPKLVFRKEVREMSESTGLSQVELVVKDGNEERVVVLSRNKFGKKVWREFEGQAKLNEIFGHGRRLYGGECLSCGRHMVVRVWSKRTGPECVLIRYRCLGCGDENEDVLD